MGATAERMTSGEGLLEVLRAYGVEYVFSSPGSEWPAVWDVLARNEAEGRQPRYVNTRHEMVAVGVAAGYYRQTRRLPAVLLHTGVGTAHCAMELRAARAEQIPLAVMAGEGIGFGEWPGRDPGAQFYRYLADVGGPAELAAPFVKRASTVGSAAALLGLVADTCRLALTPPEGPVFLSVPMELMLGAEGLARPGPFAPPPAPLQPTPGALEIVAEQLVAAERPLILAEQAGKDPANVARLVALADALSIPVVEAYAPVYLNFPRDHPLHQGYDATSLLKDADLVLLVGCPIPWYPASARPAQARVIALDPDPAHAMHPYWAVGLDESLGGALGPTLDGLLAAARERQLRGDSRVQERRTHWQDQHDRQRAAWRRTAASVGHDTPIDPRWAAHVLGEVLPADAILSEELTTERVFLLQGLPRTEPGTYQGRNHGGLGVSVSTALGLKFAAPERLVVNVVGDGAFNYNPVFAAFGFQQQWDTPVLTVLFNNGSYAAMKNALGRYFPEGWAVRTGIYPGSEITPVPDYVRFAESFGAHAERVTDPAALRDALTRALARVRDGQPALVDVVTAALDPRRLGG
ncbi:MAG TPA: thiamine pyrophosphate-dependent enzyme [Chloroflexota bacterium]|nr:thiamine pyrophosphate-dependent enzyme [Chloroflexota bacterium]